MSSSSRQDFLFLRHYPQVGDCGIHAPHSNLDRIYMINRMNFRGYGHNISTLLEMLTVEKHILQCVR